MAEDMIAEGTVKLLQMVFTETVSVGWVRGWID